ncbi:MAG: beta-mannosidase [Ruminococcus sp.]|nr:beta-mannosidase [Ruminococcus sp.]MBQ8297750.1 beta-mannosidase [Ruminococcus sp.]
MYQIDISYTQVLSTDSREQTISVNGKDTVFNLVYADEWTDYTIGVFRLQEGINTIILKPQYGYASYDTITISKAISHDYSKATDSLVDPEATDEAKALMKYLKSVYGDHTISGQQEIYGGGSSAHQSSISLNYNASTGSLTDSSGNEYTYNEADVATADDGSTFVWNCVSPEGKKYSYNQQNRNYSTVNYDLEFEYIQDLTGELPAIRGFDFMNYNPLYGWDDGTTQRCIDWVNETGGIATASWHINVPIDFENYELGDALDWTECTYKNYQSSNSTFNTANAVIEGTKEYEYFQLAMADLAEQLLILQENNVPLIFRPLHEAQGNEGRYGGTGTAWFWWGDQGCEVYKELWKLLYTTLTEEYGLHNLIWEYNSYAHTNSENWYPGDEYVDIVAYDKYNVDNNRDDGLTSGPNFSAISSIFNYIYDLVDGGKMIAMSENDTVPTVENMVVEDAGWLYFCPWYTDHIMSDRYQDPEALTAVYQSDYCITLDELPENLYVLSGEDPQPATPAPTTEPDVPTTTDGGEDIVYGDADGDGVVGISDAVKIMSYVTDKEKYPLTDAQIEIADVYQKGDGLSNMDALSIQKKLAQLLSGLPESNAE